MKHRAQDDFYLHVNYDWLTKSENNIPSDYSSWGGFIKLYDQSLRDQINLLRELDNKQQLNDEENKILAIWKASTTLFENWRNGKGDYKCIINELDILDEHFKNSNINSS